MSLSDEEALFDDIYGDEPAPVKQETPKEPETTAPEEPTVKTEEGSIADSSALNTTVETTAPTSASDEKKATETTASPEGTQVKTEEASPSSTATPSTTDQTIPPPPPKEEKSFPPVAPPPPAGPSGPSAPGAPAGNTHYMSQQKRDEDRRRADLSRDASKMFVGGLDWDTTEDSMKEYFSQFGEVIDHTIMRENTTGRSRGFGFLTFADPKSVDKVVRQQHVLDGKVIDPKRAIPREEQDKTGKIFVGGLPPEVRPHEFEAFFAKFGSIIDAQLMLDKDTGRSRGFGFVTFDEPEAVDKACQSRFIDFNGKKIEVKRAEARGAQQQQNHRQQQQERQMGQQSQQYGGNMNMNMGMNVGAMAGMFQQQQQMQQMQAAATPEAFNDYVRQLEQYWKQVEQTQQVTPEMTAQFQQYMQAVKQQADAATAAASVPSRPSAPSGPASYGPAFGASALPRGPGGGNFDGNRGGRGRGGHRGGYNNRNSGYHPYSRN